MQANLLDHRAHDGSRHFATLPDAFAWDRFHDHIQRLPGATVTEYLTNHVTDMWLDFTFRGHAFSVNSQLGELWFFVRDPACPDDILRPIVEHCEALFNARRQSIALAVGGATLLGFAELARLLAWNPQGWLPWTTPLVFWGVACLSYRRYPKPAGDKGGSAGR